MNMEEKRRRLKKDGRPLYVEEDDPIKFKLAVSILTMKLFADQERK
jgi:DnaJ family protein C protein 8